MNKAIKINTGNKSPHRAITFVIICLGCFFAHLCHALEPHEILVLANRNVATSIELAEYYMEKRGLPEENIIKLAITDKEQCSRADYDTKVVAPLRKHFKENDASRRIRCLLTMYGLPIKISAPRISQENAKDLERLKKEKKNSEARLKGSKNPDDEAAASLRHELENLKKHISLLNKKNQRASFDSEIALALKGDYPLNMWVPNPYFVGYSSKEMMNQRDDVLMVSRLDGPSDKVVRRIIDESLETEKSGLEGTAYFDARWPRPNDGDMRKHNFGYDYYDFSIYRAAEKVKTGGLVPVVVNDKQELFKTGACPDAALYCGWYSLGRYVDSFEWRPGAIGYHIASSECTTLKRKTSNVWCKKMLEKGIAATIGPTSEPYVQAFPIPEIFFGFLLDGYWTLAECYALSKPFWSWQMVLVGDPLYRPFKNRPRKPES